MSVSHKIIMNAACATASHFLLQPLSYPKYRCKSYHVSKVIALAKKAVRKQEWMECAYRSSSCLSLEMEKGMSPYSKFPDKSLQRQEKTETN